jgi:glycosyltransferase involved in cell wall biosynthesis
VFVDDGSTDSTADRIREHVSELVFLCRLEQNVGKGEAIRQGFAFARRTGLLDRADWFGYWDADWSTPLTELDEFFSYARLYDIDRVDAIFGSRVLRLGSRIDRSPVRHYLGRAFTTIIDRVFALRCYDTQCGSKLFRTPVAEEAFGETFTSRWIFDVEILLRLRGRRIVEYPLRAWSAVDGGTLSVGRELIPTLRDIVRIRSRYRSR